MYQMPNWEWNEIGDPSGADHMNYVYVGFSEGGDYGEDECDSDTLGDVNADQQLNILDVIEIINYIFGNLDFDDCQKSLADFSGDNAINISDIVLAINCILSGGC